jgi:hypothetical protein
MIYTGWVRGDGGGGDDRQLCWHGSAVLGLAVYTSLSLLVFNLCVSVIGVGW